MKIETLRDVLIRDLRNFLSAEVQLARALPEMARATNDGELASALVEHLAQAKGHTEWTRKALRRLGGSTRAGSSKSMRGLIAESKKALGDKVDSSMRDTLVVSIAQRLRDYEISACRTMISYADVIEEDEVITLLEKSLEEEWAAGKKLTRIARAMTGVDITD